MLTYVNKNATLDSPLVVVFDLFTWILWEKQTCIFSPTGLIRLHMSSIVFKIYAFKVFVLLLTVEVFTISENEVACTI